MFDSKPEATYSHLFQKLDEKGIAYIEIKEASSHDDSQLKEG
jgi:hypothetical protein